MCNFSVYIKIYIHYFNQFVAKVFKNVDCYNKHVIYIYLFNNLC